MTSPVLLEPSLTLREMITVTINADSSASVVAQELQMILCTSKCQIETRRLQLWCVDVCLNGESAFCGWKTRRRFISTNDKLLKPASQAASRSVDTNFVYSCSLISFCSKRLIRIMMNDASVKTFCLLVWMFLCVNFYIEELIQTLWNKLHE